MDIERNNLLSIAKLVIREVLQVSFQCQQLVIDGSTTFDSPPRNTLAETKDALFERLSDIIEQCLCHGLRKDPFINETFITLPSDSYSNKDTSFSSKSVFRRAKEQVLSTANNLINLPLNLPNPWPVILHMEQMLPDKERISTNIISMSEVRTGLGKSRVWIRQALMSKQLGTFFFHMAEFPKGSASLPSVQLSNGTSNDGNSLTYVTCPGHMGFYHPESLMLNDECVIFCGLLSEMSSIDFRFDIKNSLKDLDGGLLQSNLLFEVLVLPFLRTYQLDREGILMTGHHRVSKILVQAYTLVGVEDPVFFRDRRMPTAHTVLHLCMIYVIDRDSLAVDERKYLKDINAKLLKHLNESQATNQHMQRSLRVALDSVEKMKVENHSLRITVDHLKRSSQLERQRTASNCLLVADPEGQSGGTTPVSSQVEKVPEVGELRERIKVLTLELEGEKNLLSAVRSDLSTRRADHEQLLHLYSKSQSVVDQKDMVIRHLEDKNTGMVNIIDQMKERLHKVDTQRLTCEQDASRLRLEVASLEGRCSQQQTDIHAQRQMITGLEGQLDERAEQLAEFQQCREALADYKQRNTQLSTALEKWRSRCQEQEYSLCEMAAVVSSSKLEADSLRESHSALVDARWVDDAQVEVCSLCKSRFSITLRRHHCRNCGLVFCYACSANTMQLPSSAKPVRVCDPCHTLLMQRYSTNH